MIGCVELAGKALLLMELCSATLYGNNTYKGAFVAEVRAMPAGQLQLAAYQV